jgi:hypothetical protein
MNRTAALPEPTAVAMVRRSPLRVGAVDDPAEVEAKAVADRVMRMPSPRPAVIRRCPGGCPDEEVIRRCPGGCPDEDVIRRCPGGCPDEEAIRRQPVGGDDVDDDEEVMAARRQPVPGGGLGPGASVGPVIASPRGGGVPLPGGVRRFFEPRFGVDLSPVRVHHDGEAAGLAAAVRARAFTVGSDVFFGAGEWAPGTSRGDRLLAHELTHTLQARPTPDRGRLNVGRDPAGEVRRAPVQSPRYEAQPGDSLSKIAGYPDSGWEPRLDQLIAANPDHPNIKGKARSDPRFGWLEIGDKLTIPWGSCPVIQCPFEPTRPALPPPPPGVPPYPQRQRIGPAECRGACGADCEPNNCQAVAPIVYCHYDAASGCHVECHYTDVQMCFTHQGCRVHDACYDRCVAGGETAMCPLGFCHCGCDNDCRTNFDSQTCIAWARGLRTAPSDGELFYTNTVTQGGLAPGACVP